jgi:hypothetical protein
VLDGFFPLVDAAARPRKTARAGLQEWGLPFASEAEVTRHLAAFVGQHAGGEAIDLVLFNGGALTPALIRDRLLAQLADWRGGQAPAVLDSASLDLAVSRGAAYYGLVRRGLGVRIGGGSPRAYYLGVAAGADLPADSVDTLCLVARGTHEGESTEIDTPEFKVIANRPVSFPLFSSTTRLGDAAGALVRAPRESLTELPPIRTVLRFGKKLAATELPVHVGATLTEVGTLDVWCRSRTTDHRWRLQFALRDARPSDDDATAAPQSDVELAVSDERLAAAQAALARVFPSTDGVPAGADANAPLTLVRDLETALDAGKDAWPLATIRTLWDALLAGAAARAASPAHEARWLNLCGFLLRPGFGHALDDWRVQQLWKLYSRGLCFPRAVQCRVEWWGVWKRIAGGLSRAQQQELFNQTAPWLLPRLKGRSKEKRAQVGPQEVREYWQLVASCERLAADSKAELGTALVRLVEKGKATDAEIWSLGRLGARAPLHGPLNCVVPRATVEAWVAAVLAVPWARPASVVFALVQLARATGDRERDLDGALRAALAERLRAQPQGARAARLVIEVIPLEGQERARILDESLPVGLQLG